MNYKSSTDEASAHVFGLCEEAPTPTQTRREHSVSSKKGPPVAGGVDLLALTISPSADVLILSVLPSIDLNGD